MSESGIGFSAIEISGKGKAWEAWKKNGHPSVDRIVQVIALAKKSTDWIRDNGQYIPNPATWLNQRRWDDDYGPVQQERGVVC